MSNSDGKHTIKNMPVDFERVKALMDQDTYKWHHDTHYAGYVNKRNEIEQALQSVDRSKANANYSSLRGLKVEETWNANGMLLHEVYWDTMGGDGTHNDGSDVIKKITEDFGSFQAWQDDFTAVGKAGRGWVVLVVDLLSDGKLRNVLYDVHNQGGIVGSMPLIAVDVFEHAYYHKYGPDRASYLKDLIGNIDWARVDSKFKNYKR